MTGQNGSGPPPAEWLDGPAGRDAPKAVARVQAEIGAYLRVPYLGPFWRSLSWNEDAYTAIWADAKPLLASVAVEREAADLRRAALITEAAEMSSHQAFKGDLVRSEIDHQMREQIANYNAAVQYSLAKSLLVATWLIAPPSAAAQGTPTDETIPVGLARGAFAVPPVPPDEVRGRLAELLEEIPRAHGHPIADEYFRALGRLTDYLNAAWNAIKPVVRDEPYEDRASALTVQAEAALARLPARPAVLALDLAGADRERFERVLRYFARRHLPDLLIDVSMIKGLTDGPELAQVNRYDLS